MDNIHKIKPERKPESDEERKLQGYLNVAYSLTEYKDQLIEEGIEEDYKKHILCVESLALNRLMGDLIHLGKAWEFSQSNMETK
jgi:hypothetical protein